MHLAALRNTTMLLAAARRSLFATARTRLASFTASASRRRLCTAPPESSPGLVGHITQQVQSELANATKTSAHFYGFFGACCNWFLGISAVYDASSKGPEVISLKMTGVMLAYSTLFGAWAGWAVMPRNFILAGSHIFNVLAQSNQMRRCLEYKMANDPGGAAEVQELGKKAGAALAGVAVFAVAAPHLKAMMPVGTYLASAGGPFTIHPWPPMTKLAISGTSLLELNRPTDKISLSQYSALTVTGALFSRYGLVVTPINYPLTCVNILLFASSFYHLSRKIKADYM